MAMDLLLEALARNGDAEARGIVDAAREQADGIRKAADGRAERCCAEAVASREMTLRTELDARRARAVREARARVLASRAAFLERIFTAGEQALPGALDDPTSIDVLPRLCREALACLPATGVRVRCRPGLAAVLARDQHSLGNAEVVPDETIAEGVLAEATDGTARVDNTLVARLRRFRPALSIALVNAVAAEWP